MPQWRDRVETIAQPRPVAPDATIDLRIWLWRGRRWYRSVQGC